MRTRVLVAAMCGVLLAGCPATDPDPQPTPDAGTKPDAGVPPEALNLTGSKQGQAVALADLDGDGLEDKLVGAPYAQLEAGLGAVLFYPGTQSGFAVTPKAVLTGGDNFGFSIADVGDLDGDGRAEIAVGAIGGGALTGSVTVLKGGGSGAVLRTLERGTPMAKFGYALASGDLDGDGARDLVVGAPFHTANPAAYLGGAVFIFFGPDFERIVPLAAQTPAEAGLGWSLTVGDISGDGVDDLLISDTGDVLAFFGGASFAPVLSAPNLRAKATAAQFGRALAVLSDVDGDGVGDLAIGAPGAKPGGGRDTGSVYLVRGGVRVVDVDAAPPVDGLIVRLDGQAQFQRFGAALSTAADIDDDGKPELAIGAPLTDGDGLVLSGRVHLFRSTKLGPTTVATDAVAFSGTKASQWFGASLARSSTGRLLIGAPRADADTGGVAMVDLKSGAPVPGGGSGGTGGTGGEDCH